MEHDQNPFLSPEAERLGRQSISHRGMTLEDVLRAAGATAPPDSLSIYAVDRACTQMVRGSCYAQPFSHPSIGAADDGMRIAVYVVCSPASGYGTQENS